MHRITVCLVFIAAAGVTLPAQNATNWRLEAPVTMTSGNPVATHPWSGRPLRLGSDWSLDPNGSLWHWQGTQWSRLPGPSGPYRTGHAMVTDDRRHALLLFGDRLHADTLTFDGWSWQTHRSPALLLPRTEHMLTFDSRRGRIVLFGGKASNNALLGDTWEWDGTQWLLQQPALPPSPRSRHAMAYDSTRGNTVLFGEGETWLWDGAQWQQRLSTTTPGLRFNHGMAEDPIRGRIVLFGGVNQSLGAVNDTWEWDGSGWRRIATPNTPSPGTLAILYRTQMVFDRSRARVTLVRSVLGDELLEFDGSDWTNVPMPARPSARSHSGWVEDPVRGEFVLFGGYATSGSGNPTRNDTWLFDGSNWRAATPTNAPSPRGGHAFAFDPARGVAILFGGDAGNRTVVHDDTWSWDGTAWRLVAPTSRPGARIAAAMAWHAPTQRLVLFGGETMNLQPLGDTWTFDGSSWTQASPTTSPSARSGSASVGTGNEVLLFGGRDSRRTPWQLGETWHWDGTDWTRLQPVHEPPARYGAAHTWNRDRGVFVLCSGGQSNTTPPGDTWEFDGTDWTEVTTDDRPPARVGGAIAYDARLDRLLLFGSIGSSSAASDDLWSLGAAAAQQTFGSGCIGALGVPGLQAAPDSYPHVGGHVAVTLTNLPQSLALFVMGFSNTTTGSLALPLALAPFGMPGCSLLVAPDGTLLITGSANAAIWRLPLPLAPSLLGTEFWCQAAVPDPTANAAGLTFSNGGHFRIGN